MIEKAVFTTVEVLELVKASEVTRKLEKAVFTTVQVLLSPCRPVSVARMIESAAFSTVEVL